MPKKKLPDPKGREECKHRGCDQDAIFLEDYCWKHLPQKSKKTYKAKIEAWVKEGNSLEGANLQYANLRKAKLMYVSFKGADLLLTDFRNADLTGAKFEDDASLLATDLRESYLNDVSFKNAHLLGVRLQGSYLWGACFEGAKDLTWSDVERVGEDEDEDEHSYWMAQDIYFTLKNYFHEHGRYDDESKAYYREKIVAKHWAFWHCFRWRMLYGLPKEDQAESFLELIRKKIHGFFKWLGLWFFHTSTGFGERPLFTVLWALGVIAFFGFLYWGGGAAGWFKFAFKPEMIFSPFQYFYLSVVTFATLGFGI